MATIRDNARYVTRAAPIVRRAGLLSIGVFRGGRGMNSGSHDVHDFDRIGVISTDP
jgi:hypothetical protein